MSTPMHDRLELVVGKRSYRALGELTGTHPETVRRYMQGATPSVEFLASVCDRLGVNANWLLTGQGAALMRDVRREALSKADPSELLGTIATTLEHIVERVDRMELYVQTLEAKLSHERVKGGPTHEQARPIGASWNGPGGGNARARTIAGALTQRARPDAD